MSLRTRLRRLTRRFRRAPVKEAPKRAPKPAKPPEFPYLGFSTHRGDAPADVLTALNARVTSTMPVAVMRGGAMDSAGNEGINRLKARWRGLDHGTVTEALFSWYASQTFIGFQMCAILAQHWLIDKACFVPARDAVRKGYSVSIDGTEMDAPEVKALWKAAKKYKIKRNLIEYVHQGRVFGIRIMIFQVESTDPQYYELPFNIDSVTPGSFKGMSQVDPYWCTPELSGRAVNDAASQEFYEPTWWVINGKRYHRSHLAIFRTSQPADMLKPMYMYGGIPVPQRIMERVYAAERTANEAPQLLLTKRTIIWSTDVAKFLANQTKALAHMFNWVKFRDNYGVKINEIEDKVEQHDTSLADVDVTIMGQYELVAAGANIPSTKLLSTSPKGLNATGEYEEANYHEDLESIQENDLTPVVDQYHALVLRSDIEPKFGHAPGTLEANIDWNPLATQTPKEEAETNKLKAETDQILVESGAIDGADVRDRIKKDTDSGYAGLQDKPLETGDPLTDAIAALEHSAEQAQTGAAAPGAGEDPLVAATAALTGGPANDLETAIAALTGTDALDLPHAAGVILTRPDGKTLWMKRRKGAVHGETWAWPGGSIDPGEKPQDAAVRELYEETGIAYGAPMIPVGVVDGFVAFAAVSVSPNLPVTLNDEHTEYVWASLDAPPRPMHPGCNKMLYG